MISIEQLNGEIAVLEEEKPTHIVMQKLASLYTVRDHLGIGNMQVAVIQGVPPIGTKSAFAQQIEGMEIKSFALIMDDLMNTLAIVNPRLYEGVMAKLAV